MKKVLFELAEALAVVVSLKLEVSAADYVWMSSPEGNVWNMTQKNWNDGVIWENNQANPNNAAFGTTTAGTISIDGVRYVNDLSVGSQDHTFNGTGSLSVAGMIKIVSRSNQHFAVPLAGGRADGSIWVSAQSGGADWYSAWFDNAVNQQTKTVLDGSVFLMLADDGSLGPVPAQPTENLVINGNPVVFAGKAMTFNANRTIKLNSGAVLRIGSNDSYILKGLVTAEPETGSRYSTDTVVHLYNWDGRVTFDPGTARTNAFGRLYVDKKCAKIVSGVTCLTAQNQKTGSGAALYVDGNSSAYSPTKGILTIDGGEVYLPSGYNPYVEVSHYGQVVVTNGGKVAMAAGEWLNGLNGVGRLIVEKGGEFNGNVLRVSQASGSEVQLNDGAAMKVAQLKMDTASSGTIKFDGGTFRNGANDDGRGLFSPATTDAKWSNVKSTIGTKGVRFDTAGQNVWWDLKLERADGVEQDGGVYVTGGKLLLFRRFANDYVGPTVVENGGIQARVDYAIPARSTLRLGGVTTEGTFTANTYDTESPQRMTRQIIGRIEGRGTLQEMAMSHITNSVAPAANGALKFTTVTYFDPGCVYEVSGDKTGCSCLEVKGATNQPQDISGLKVRLMNPEALDGSASRTFYKILSVATGAASGYAGKFDASEIPDGWRLKYTTDAVYLYPRQGLILVLE